jgi:hypothetical protein
MAVGDQFHDPAALHAGQVRVVGTEWVGGRMPTRDGLDLMLQKMPPSAL